MQFGYALLPASAPSHPHRLRDPLRTHESYLASCGSSCGGQKTQVSSAFCQVPKSCIAQVMNSPSHESPSREQPQPREKPTALLDLAVLEASRLIRIFTHAPLAVLFIRLVVAFKPLDVAVTFEGEDVGSNTIQKPAIMADHYGATW